MQKCARECTQPQLVCDASSDCDIRCRGDTVLQLPPEDLLGNELVHRRFKPCGECNGCSSSVVNKHFFSRLVSNARHHSIGSSECGPNVVSLVRRSWMKSIPEVWLSGDVLDGFVSVCGLVMHCPPCPQCCSVRDRHCSRTLWRRLLPTHW